MEWFGRGIIRGTILKFDSKVWSRLSKIQDILPYIVYFQNSRQKTYGFSQYDSGSTAITVNIASKTNRFSSIQMYFFIKIYALLFILFYFLPVISLINAVNIYRISKPKTYRASSHNLIVTHIENSSLSPNQESTKFDFLFFQYKMFIKQRVVYILLLL